jgi:hypothetical protein
MQRKLLLNRRTLTLLVTRIILLALFSYAFLILLSKRELSHSDLRFLKEGTSYIEIVARIGLPDRNLSSKDINPKIYLFEYNLEDNEKLTLEFTHLDYLAMARIERKNGTRFVIAPCLCCIFQENKGKAILRSDLNFLIKGITYDEVEARLGEPHCNSGSGLYLPSYRLADGSVLVLGFSKYGLDQAHISEEDGSSTNILP